MSRPSYLPTGVIALDAWLRNFLLKLPQYAGDLMISDKDIKELHAQLLMHSFVLERIAWHESELAKLYRFKDSFVEGEVTDMIVDLTLSSITSTQPPDVSHGLVKQIARIVKRIKTTPHLAEFIELDLGILAPKTNRKLAYLNKPEIRVSLDVDRPMLRWKKNGIESIDIMVDRGDGLGYVLAGSTTRAKFVDMHPLPDTLTFWTYKVIHKKGNTQIGEYSNPCSIAVVKLMATN